MTLSPRRCALSLMLFGILLAGPALLAQEPAMRITGSAIVEPLLQAMIDAAGVAQDLHSETTGSRTGLTLLCNGDSALSSSTQSISEEQIRACADNDIALAEFTLGHHILAVITHPTSAEFVSCLNEDQLAGIFAPSSAGNNTRWNQIVSTAPEDLTLTVYAPEALTAEYSLLDALVSGDGLRDDALLTRDSVAAVPREPGSIGVARLEQAQGQHLLALNTADSDGCRAPSAAVVENGLYPAAGQLLLYANVAFVNEPGINELLNLITGEDAAEVVTTAGFTSVTEAVATENQERLRTALQGESALLATGDFFIPEGLGGALRVGGSGSDHEFVNATNASLQATSPGITVTITQEGAPAAFRNLCGGALDLVFSGRTITAEEQNVCADSGIDSYTMALGSRALVLLANENSAAPACLTTAQLGEIWRAESAGTIMGWSDVNPDFSDEALTLFAPEPGSQQTDLVLAASAAGLTGRIDIELENDPLYRAAATANVAGALTFMSWEEYGRVQENGQERIRLLPLDAGAGCVSPSFASIRDSSWPLTQATLLTVNRSRLNLPAVQSFLWHMASEENFSAWESAGYVGIRLSSLNSLQTSLVNIFDEAAIMALERLNEAEGSTDAEETASG